MDFILTKHPMIEVFQCEIKEKDTLYAAFCHSCKTNFAHTAARKLKNHVASSEHERRLNLTDNLTEAEVKEQARRSQERSFSIKLEDEERKLDVNMQAVEKKLSGIVIEKSASSEIFDSNNKENISTTSQVNDSMDVKELAKENSTFENDSVLNHFEISYTQQYTEYERFADYSNSILPYMLSKKRKHMADPFYING